MNYRQVKKAIEKAGCKFERQGKGSHVIYHSPITNQNFSVPDHGSKDLKKGTLHGISVESGVRLK